MMSTIHLAYRKVNQKTFPYATLQSYTVPTLAACEKADSAPNSPDEQKPSPRSERFPAYTADSLQGRGSRAGSCHHLERRRPPQLAYHPRDTPEAPGSV